MKEVKFNRTMLKNTPERLEEYFLQTIDLTRSSLSCMHKRTPPPPERLEEHFLQTIKSITSFLKILNNCNRVCKTNLKDYTKSINNF